MQEQAIIGGTQEQDRINTIFKDITTGKKSEALQHYAANYVQGIIGKLHFIGSPETSETEKRQIYDLYRIRVAVLLQLKENIDNEDLHTYLAQQYNEWNIGVQVLEDYLNATN